MHQWTGPQNALDPHKYAQWLLGQKRRHSKEWWTCWIMLQEIILSSSSSSSTKEKAVQNREEVKTQTCKGRGFISSECRFKLMAYRSFPQLTRKGNSTQIFPFSELVLLSIYASQFLIIQPKAFKSVFLLIFLIINTLFINHWEESQICPCAFVKFVFLFVFSASLDLSIKIL